MTMIQPQTVRFAHKGLIGGILPGAAARRAEAARQTEQTMRASKADTALSLVKTILAYNSVTAQIPQEAIKVVWDQFDKTPCVRVMIPLGMKHEVVGALRQMKSEDSGNLTEVEQNLPYLNGEYGYFHGQHTPINPPSGFDDDNSIEIQGTRLYPLHRDAYNWNAQRLKLAYTGYLYQQKENYAVPVAVFTVEGRWLPREGGINNVLM
jgi:hypothetical protein